MSAKKSASDTMAALLRQYGCGPIELTGKADSKNRVTAETLGLLCRLAEECGLREHIDAMFRGDRINLTEHRAVLHVALRARRGTSIVVDGTDVVPEVHAVLDAMSDSRIVCAAVPGEGTPASASETSSTSVSAAQTSAP